MADELPEITPGQRHPGFMTNVCGFVVSFKNWCEAGMPWRSPAEAQELFTTHCRGIFRNNSGNVTIEPCPEYDPEKRAFPGWPKGTCLMCGCHVSGDAYQLLNKVNKPHHGCPLGKWDKVIDFAS